MTDIEFLVPEEPDRPEESARTHLSDTLDDQPDSGSPARPQVDTRFLLAALLFLFAAALAVAASFTDLYSVRQTQGSSRLDLHIDGWGRYATDPATVIPHGLHGLRYGIALAPAALLLVIACLLLAVEAVRAGTFGALRDAVVPVSCGVAGLLLGIGAAMGFDVQSRADQIGISNGSSDGQTSQLSFGPSTWLTLAGGALAVAAVVLFVRATRPAPPERLAG